MSPMWDNQGTEYSGAITNTMPSTPDRLYSGLGVVAFGSTDRMSACAVADCVYEGLLSRGFCPPHYQKWYRAQHPRPNPPCPVCGRVGRDPRRHARTHDLEVQASRFWAKVDHLGADECWEWKAARNKNGYGEVRWGGASARSHRVAYELANGPIPAGLAVCHACDNPPCCNPAHLFLGTSQENTADRVAKGRSARVAGDANGSHLHPEALWRGSRNHQSKLTEPAVVDIRQRLAAGESHRSIARSYGVVRETISAIARGQRWRHVA